MDELQEQSNNKPWLFKPGQSGNPAGRPKGSKSLKTFALEYLLSLDDDEKMEYLAGLDKKVIWEMAEGKAPQTNDLNLKATLLLNFDPSFNASTSETEGNS